MLMSYHIVREWEDRGTKNFRIVKTCHWPLETVIREAERMVKMGEEKLLLIFEELGGVKVAPIQAVRIGPMSLVVTEEKPSL
jgi:hypothetical protein